MQFVQAIIVSVHSDWDMANQATKWWSLCADGQAGQTGMIMHMHFSLQPWVSEAVGMRPSMDFMYRMMEAEEVI